MELQQHELEILFELNPEAACNQDPLWVYHNHPVWMHRNRYIEYETIVYEIVYEKEGKIDKVKYEIEEVEYEQRTTKHLIKDYINRILIQPFKQNFKR